MDEEPPKTPETQENAPAPEPARARPRGKVFPRNPNKEPKVVPLRDANGFIIQPALQRGDPRIPRRLRGNGEGWGGPAVGKPSGGMLRRQGIKPSYNAKMRLTGETPEAKANREAVREEAMQFYAGVLGDEEQSALMRMAAADKLLDRIEGKPVNRVAPAAAGQTVEEMREIDPKLLTQEERDHLRRLMERQLAAQGRIRGS